jgi:hypothetical protein
VKISMSILDTSPTIRKYKDTMKRCIMMYYPEIDQRELENILNYSIEKRYLKSDAKVDNSYTHKVADMTLLAVSDYIMSREPIVTSFGTMFRKQGEVPNPLFLVVQSFMDKRGEYKNKMFRYPKGSEQFEKYNLQQQLSKIDANGLKILF